MTLIIGLSGRKQSGKSLIAEFLSDPLRDPPAFSRGTVVKRYAFADPIKKMCVDILGIPYEQVYGTDEQKNLLTQYRWEDLPHYDEILEDHYADVCMKVTQTYAGSPYRYWLDRLTGRFDQKIGEAYLATIPFGPMTGRQILQQVGTEIFRRMNEFIWVDATLRQIFLDNPDIAVIDDVRFPGEVEAIKECEGIVIRLQRAPFRGKDEHESESALDGYLGFSHVIEDGLPCEYIRQVRRILEQIS